MVLLADSLKTEQKAGRLTLQSSKICQDTTAIRCLDWDRDRFDIEFELQNGTTYNSFLIQGEQTALVDTSHAKFRDQYGELLTQLIDPAQLTYLVISHTEPDHSGLVADVLAIAPHITVVGAKVAIQFLENMVHQPFQSRVVKNGDTLDLGNGHVLEFVSAPNLHWPDTIFTYDHGTQILYTCDAFGMHYCDEHLYDEFPHLLEQDFKYYYDCLMGPNARSVLMALKRISKLSVQQVATGHGPLLQHHVGDWMDRYRQWSEAQAKTEGLAVLFYRSGYGYSDELVEAIARGITKTEVELELIDLSSTDPHEVRELATAAAGIVIGMPPHGQHDA
jgi:flavorubredoxin